MYFARTLLVPVLLIFGLVEVASAQHKGFGILERQTVLGRGQEFLTFFRSSCLAGGGHRP